MRAHLLKRAETVAAFSEEPGDRVPEEQRPALALATVVGLLRGLEVAAFEAKLREGAELLRDTYGGDLTTITQKLRKMTMRVTVPEPKDVWRVSCDLGWTKDHS